MTDRPAPAELSVFLATPAGADAAGTYRAALDTIEWAEELGYDHAWVAEAHFTSTIAIPSALAFLAAATQRTRRIGLGTAVIPLAFDSPLRLAETAALVDALSGGRLELGVGKGNPRGFSTDAFTAFGLDEGDRDGLFTRALAALKTSLGHPVDLGDKQVPVYPPATGLLQRIWQATGNPATAASAAAAGDGLQLFRTVPAEDGPAGEVQAQLIDHYRSAFDHDLGAPRIGISRSVLLAGSRAEAIALARADYEGRPEAHPPFARPEGTSDAAIAAHLTRTTVAFGSIDDVVETLNQDAAVVRSTNHLFNFPFTAPGSTALREALTAVAAEVRPRLEHVAPVAA